MDKTALLHRRLYRALLRQGALFDKNPAAKLLLYRKHTLLKNKQDRLNEAAGYYQLVLLRLLFHTDGRRLLEPSASESTSLRELVKKEYRRDRMLPISETGSVEEGEEGCTAQGDLIDIRESGNRPSVNNNNPDEMNIMFFAQVRSPPSPVPAPAPPLFGRLVAPC